MKFCEGVAVPVKSVKVFANSKPWVSANVNKALHEKNTVFAKGGDREECKAAQKQLEKVIKKG